MSGAGDDSHLRLVLLLKFVDCYVSWFDASNNNASNNALGRIRSGEGEELTRTHINSALMSV